MEHPPKARVLFVDDDPDFLAAMVRMLRAEQYDLTTVTSGKAALELVRDQGPFAVVVSDLRMPEIDGVDLLRRCRKLAPDTVRVLFTGQLDLDCATAAVNEGAVFRFVVKPCPRVVLAITLSAAVKQYRLITAERVLLEQTLRGSIQALTDVCALASPLAFGRATRLRQAATALVSAMRVEESWHVEVAAMLSQIGSVILPPDTLDRVYQGHVLSETEEEMIARMPAVTEQILGNIPRLEPVRDILRYARKRYDGGGPPAEAIAGEGIPWGARALKALVDLDTLETEGLSTSLALDTLRGRHGWYDPVILQALADLHNSDQSAEVRELPLANLRPGMILAQDVRTRRGFLFVARGYEVTESLVEKLMNYGSELYVKESIRVILPERVLV